MTLAKQVETFQRRYVATQKALQNMNQQHDALVQLVEPGRIAHLKLSDEAKVAWTVSCFFATQCKYVTC